jgi:hypothetical protein
MDGFKNSTRMKYMDEGVSTRPTDSSGRRMTNEELGMTPGGVDPAKKKPVAKPAAKKAVPAGGIGGAAAGAAAGALAGAAARAARQRGDAALLQRATGAAMTEGERRAILAAKKAVPAHSDRPMIRRKTGGLASMPKGKCK